MNSPQALRKACIDSLVAIDAKEAVGPLTQLLLDDKESIVIREQTANALAGTNHPEAHAALIKALQNEDYDMSKLEAFRRENFDYLDTGSADRVIDWLILDDPPAGARPASGPARHDPAAAAVTASPSAATRG